MYRGDDKDFAFTLTQDALPVDLTGAAIVFSGRAADDFDADEAAAFTLSEADGDIDILTDQATTGKGKVTVTIPADVSVDLLGLYLCDVEVTLGGEVWTWPEPAYGQSTLIRLKVKADVTHP